MELIVNKINFRFKVVRFKVDFVMSYMVSKFFMNQLKSSEHILKLEIENVYNSSSYLLR